MTHHHEFTDDTPLDTTKLKNNDAESFEKSYPLLTQTIVRLDESLTSLIIVTVKIFNFVILSCIIHFIFYGMLDRRLLAIIVVTIQNQDNALKFLQLLLLVGRIICAYLIFCVQEIIAIPQKIVFFKGPPLYYPYKIWNINE